jgi:hypothetical protein
VVRLSSWASSSDWLPTSEATLPKPASTDMPDCTQINSISSASGKAFFIEVLPPRFAVRPGGSKRLRQASSFAVILGALPEARAADARRSMRARDFAVGVLTGDVGDDQALQDDHVTLHADHTVTCVILREPSRRREACTIMSIEPMIISRMVLTKSAVRAPRRRWCARAACADSF